MASLPFKTSNPKTQNPLALPSFPLQPRIPRQEETVASPQESTQSIPEKPPSKEAIHIGPKRLVLCFESAMNDMADELHSTMTLSNASASTSTASATQVKMSASSSARTEEHTQEFPVLQLPLEGSGSYETTLQNPKQQYSSEKAADHHKFNRSSTPSTAASTKSSSSMESASSPEAEDADSPAAAMSTLPSSSHRTMMTSEADILAVMRGEAPAISQQQHPAATTATHPHFKPHPAWLPNRSAAPPPMLHQHQPPQQPPTFGTVLAAPQGNAAGSAFPTAPPAHAASRLMLIQQPQPHSFAWNHHHHSYNANHKRSRTASSGPSHSNHASATLFAQPGNVGSSALLPKQSHKRLKVGPIPQQERKQSNLDLLCSVAASIDPSPAQASAPVPSVSTKQTPNLNKLKMKQTKKTKNTSKQSCKCIKRHCLSLYCACFRVGAACGMDCQCCPGQDEDVKCHNVQDDERREQARKSMLEINPRAFDPPVPIEQRKKVQRTGDPTHRDDTDNDAWEYEQGCTCKKTACLKLYCACMSNGGKLCNPLLCKCVGCLNTAEQAADPNSRRSVALQSMLQKRHKGANGFSLASFSKQQSQPPASM